MGILFFCYSTHHGDLIFLNKHTAWGFYFSVTAHSRELCCSVTAHSMGILFFCKNTHHGDSIFLLQHTAWGLKFFCKNTQHGDSIFLLQDTAGNSIVLLQHTAWAFYCSVTAHSMGIILFCYSMHVARDPIALLKHIPWDSIVLVDHETGDKNPFETPGVATCAILLSYFI
jgi:hypothetical protein